LSYKQDIGLHLRLSDNIEILAQQALSLGLNTFQFFLIPEKSKRHITIKPDTREAFLQLRPQFGELFIHSSYWINPSSHNKEVLSISKNLLTREIEMAKMLEINNLVLHAGSAKGYPADKNDTLGIKRGINTLADLLNKILKEEQNIRILIENGAHGKNTVCSNLGDFTQLRKELNYPEKIGFCLDTAHAFAYGYDLENCDNFIKIVDQTMGIENIKLIHFNDSHDPFGSMQDRHEFPGQGTIGSEILQNLLNHKALTGIPKIIECPDSSLPKAYENLKTVYSWIKKNTA